MNQERRDLMTRNSIFIWIALATAAILLAFFIAAQVTTEILWDETDFIVMGLLLLVTASSFVLVARRAPRRRRVFIGMIFLAIFLYVWAELAVGVFTNFGS